ncbi:IclR family transcriptional regulator [Pelomonas sp. P7]|uniref:IclR family transcriptional regulator n=1 Tax=Pelomonas caseinilytica TaxID=2906763 RepID=A0ABS8XB26_9BURK|nr:IclR family transcriptional regulator [Pelomonas sp. P7]
MSSLTRMLSVLDLFSRDHTTMTAEQIADALALSRTTCYRYTRELTQAGLLVSHGGQFMLGPRIIELDYRMLDSDPLINAGGPIVSELADAMGATGLLTAIYDDHIVNVFAHSGSPRPLPLSFGRGTTMPMFKSSTSKVLLSMMSRGRLMRLWERHQHTPDCRTIGADWKAFWRTLQEIRQRGYAASFGELTPELAGISAPVSFNDGGVAGCISLVFLREYFDRFDLQLLGTRLCAAAADVSKLLAGLKSPAAPAAPSRARGRRTVATKPAAAGAQPGARGKTAKTAPARKPPKRTAAVTKAL